MKLQFSGHESFICKQFWLKKGYDFITNNGSFSAETAVVSLGVGKNMVTSISYWLKAFGIVDANNDATQFGHILLDDKKGLDPYFEHIGTIWLLHYLLISTNKASLYHIFFNEFRKGRNEFTKDQLLTYILRKLENSEQTKVNENTINSDISVFMRNYLKPDYKSNKADIEDDFSNLLIDLSLLKTYQSENAEGKSVDWYHIDTGIQVDLPYQIVLFSILDNPLYGISIPFRELMVAVNIPGLVFLLNEEGLYHKIEQITSAYKDVVYTETAGVRELQIKGEIDKWKVLHEYYKN